MESAVITIILLPILFLLGIQWLAKRRAKRSLGRQVSTDNIITENNQRKVYFFYAPHCSPCRGIKPLVERLSTEFPNLALVNITEQPDRASEFGIAATPSFIVVDGTTIVKVKLGAVSESWLRRHLAVDV